MRGFQSYAVILITCALILVRATAWSEAAFSTSAPYDILGVARNASDDDIKKAYRKLAMKYHPDRSPGDKAAEETYKKIQAAYFVLNDAEARTLLDEGRLDLIGQKGWQAEWIPRSQKTSKLPPVPTPPPAAANTFRPPPPPKPKATVPPDPRTRANFEYVSSQLRKPYAAGGAGFGLDAKASERIASDILNRIAENVEARTDGDWMRFQMDRHLSRLHEAYDYAVREEGGAPHQRGLGLHGEDALLTAEKIAALPEYQENRDRFFLRHQQAQQRARHELGLGEVEAARYADDLLSGLQCADGFAQIYRRGN